MNLAVLERFLDDKKHLLATDFVATHLLSLLLRTKVFMDKHEIVKALQLEPILVRMGDDSLLTDAIQILANRNKIRFSPDRKMIQCKDLW